MNRKRPMRDVIVGFIVWPALITLSYPLYALFELRCYLIKRRMKGLKKW